MKVIRKEFQPGWSHHIDTRHVILVLVLVMVMLMLIRLHRTLQTPTTLGFLTIADSTDELIQ